MDGLGWEEATIDWTIPKRKVPVSGRGVVKSESLEVGGHRIYLRLVISDDTVFFGLCAKPIKSRVAKSISQTCR